MFKKYLLEIIPALIDYICNIVNTDQFYLLTKLLIVIEHYEELSTAHSFIHRM